MWRFTFGPTQCSSGFTVELRVQDAGRTEVEFSAVIPTCDSGFNQLWNFDGDIPCTNVCTLNVHSSHERSRLSGSQRQSGLYDTAFAWKKIEVIAIVQDQIGRATTCVVPIGSQT
jgi:hypothetical protein